MREKHWGVLLGFAIATIAAGTIGSLATQTSVTTWYPTLVKPAWNPPSAAFAPVWTLLYLAMTISAWRAWRAAAAGDRTRVAAWYLGQLVLNALWSVIFFGLRQPAFALVDILVLWTVLVVVLVRWWRLDRVAGALWAPYVAWVSFAVTLNAGVAWLNR